MGLRKGGTPVVFAMLVCARFRPSGIPLLLCPAGFRSYLINALSLTTPALSRVFSLLYCQTRAHFSVGARTASFSAASVHLCHPNLLSPFTISNSVLPTKHLFDHHRP